MFTGDFFIMGGFADEAINLEVVHRTSSSQRSGPLQILGVSTA